MGKKQTVTQKNSPWKPAQGALQGIIDDASTMYAQGGMRIDPYAGPRVAPQSANTIAGMDAMAAPSAVTAPATGAYIDMLNADPYRDFDLIRQTVGDDVQSRVNSSGISFNGSGGQDYLTRAMTEALAGVEYGAYNQAQDRQLRALGMAPTIAGLGNTDARMTAAAGTMQDTYNQSLIDADQQKYLEGANADIDALRRYAGIATGIGGMGGTSTQSSPYNWGGFLGNVGQLAGGAGGLLGVLMGGN